MESIITVELPQQSYPIVISAGALNELGGWMRSSRLAATLGEQVMLISNPEIFKFYGDKAIASLTEAGFQVNVHLIPAGETHKTLESIQKIYDTALEHRLERSSTLVALGGGVIGDMTGFAAATWLRGVNFVQVPTSLLAMVDAAIGGKTGVNHPQGKNLIGAFYQPRLVLVDPEVLQTLPTREFRAGMAEVIKYGVIWDADLFGKLESTSHLNQLETLPLELMQSILLHSCQAKVEVVSQDEKEAGLRAILNYGHTVGHAIESLTGYHTINHGEAVAIGMVAAAYFAQRLNLWPLEAVQRQQALLEKTQLPTRIPPNLTVDAIKDALTADKKVKAGKVRFILPTAIGQVTITDAVPQEVTTEVLVNLGATQV